MKTKSILQEACDHLIQVDPRMQVLIEKNPCPIFSSEAFAKKIDPFESLVNSMIAQQISGAAAQSIKKKFIALFQDQNASTQFPTPCEVEIYSIESLQNVGLSQRKAEYIKGLAKKFTSGELTKESLYEASDQELIEKLITVRGLGRWSIEMFAMFGLKRMDIFSIDDLGIQKGVATFIGKDITTLRSHKGKWKYISKEEMLAFSAPFAPYRSLLMWVMWQIQPINLNIMKQ